MDYSFLGWQGYIARGHSYLREPPLVVLHSVSDGLIAIACVAIAVTLLRSLRPRQPRSLGQVMGLLGLFIMVCGLGHLLDIWTMWFPHQGLAEVVKAVTALGSGLAAFRLGKLMPQFLRLRSPQALELLNQQLSVEIKQRQQSQQQLQQVLEGTATKTGQAFFSALAENLASALSVRYVTITETSPSSARLRLLANWPAADICPSDLLDPTGTPCEQIIQTKQSQQYLSQVQAQFPQAHGLKAANAQCYVGVPIKDGNSQIFGVLCIYHDRPLQDVSTALAIMTLFAEKAAAELQRQRIDAVLQQAYDDLEQRVRDRTADLARANAHLQRLALRARTTATIVQRIRHSLDLEQIFATVTSELRRALECDRVLVYRFTADWSGYIVAETVATPWESCCPPSSSAHSPTQTSWPSHLVGDERCIVHLQDNGHNRIRDTHLQTHQGGVYRQTVDYISVPDIYAANFSDCYLKLLESLQARAYLIVPIYVNGELWGLLANYQNDGPYLWDDEEIQMAVQIGSQLGVAIQQTELLNRTLEQAEALRQAKESADASNCAKSDFLAHMSHELRTPLNAILGFTQLLGRDTALSPQHQHYIKIINSSGEHLLGLINNVLEMSKIEAGQLERYDSDFELNPFFEDIRAILSLKAQQKGLEFFFERLPNLPSWIRTDENKLRQILFNLLGNAIKFTEAGHVCLRVGTVTGGDEDLDRRDQSCVLKIEVEDSGPGIDPAERDRLFEAFHQTQTGLQSAQGTGLGLPISRCYAQLMNGSLTVDSQPGRGARFTLMLPVACQSPPLDCDWEDGLAALPTGAANAHSIRILVAEDNDLNRLLLREYLLSLRYNVREVEDGQAAIALWQTWRPHLILMDMRMPKLDGQQATQAIRQIEAQNQLEPTVILAVTATAFEDKRREMLAAGCNDVICKPFQADDLIEALQQHLADRSLPNHPRPLAAALLQLTPDHLKDLPPPWIESLHRAACQCNDSLIKALLTEIPPDQAQLSEAIAALTAVFQFDRILALTTPLLTH